MLAGTRAGRYGTGRRSPRRLGVRLPGGGDGVRGWLWGMPCGSVCAVAAAVFGAVVAGAVGVVVSEVPGFAGGDEVGAAGSVALDEAGCDEGCPLCAELFVVAAVAAVVAGASSPVGLAFVLGAARRGGEGGASGDDADLHRCSVRCALQIVQM